MCFSWTNLHQTFHSGQDQFPAFFQTLKMCHTTQQKLQLHPYIALHF